MGHVYGLLVHSCYVDDGHGNRFDLVDDRGYVQLAKPLKHEISSNLPKHSILKFNYEIFRCTTDKYLLDEVRNFVKI